MRAMRHALPGGTTKNIAENNEHNVPISLQHCPGRGMAAQKVWHLGTVLRKSAKYRPKTSRALLEFQRVSCFGGCI
jgi:hypothetical protein